MLPAPDRLQDKEDATDGVGVRVADEDSITSSSVSIGDVQDIPAGPASSVPTKRSVELPASARSAGHTGQREQKQMRMSPAKLAEAKCISGVRWRRNPAADSVSPQGQVWMGVV